MPGIVCKGVVLKSKIYKFSHFQKLQVQENAAKHRKWIILSIIGIFWIAYMIVALIKTGAEQCSALIVMSAIALAALVQRFGLAYD